MVNSIHVFFRVHQKRFSRSKRSNASGMWTDQLVHSSVDYHEVIDHLFVIFAVDATVGTNGFALKQFHVCQEMKSIIIFGILVSLVANWAGFYGVLECNELVVHFDLSGRDVIVIFISACCNNFGAIVSILDIAFAIQQNYILTDHSIYR